jgi:hypothetical protein
MILTVIVFTGLTAAAIAYAAFWARIFRDCVRAGRELRRRGF